MMMLTSLLIDPWQNKRAFSLPAHLECLLHLPLLAHPGRLFERVVQIPLCLCAGLRAQSRALGQLRLGQEPRLNAGRADYQLVRLKIERGTNTINESGGI